MALEVSGWLRRIRALRLEPLAKLLGGLRIDVYTHVRMLKATELRALAPERARARGQQRQRGRVAGQKIFLAVEARHPEAVNHVARSHLQLHGSTQWQRQEVGGGDASRRLRILVFDFPPPLVGGDLHLQGILRRMKQEAIAEEVAD